MYNLVDLVVEKILHFLCCKAKKGNIVISFSENEVLVKQSVCVHQGG